MSLIARCPACQTLFRVVPDQLRISDGWVRCGECDEVFDASLHLVQSLVPTGLPAVPQDVAALQEDAPSPQKIWVTSGSKTETAMPGASLADELRADEQPVLLVSEDHPPSPHEPHEATLEASGSVAQSEARVQVVPFLSEAPANPECESPPDLSDISFLRRTNAPAAKPGPLTRATWAILSLVLILGLAGQMALHERDQIAARRPDLRPWLQAACDRLNCTVSPWRKIESIVIDSSAFTRIHGDSYRLSLVLKNMASVPVALPGLELTLTDTQDQSVIRRVLVPPELDDKSDFIAARSERPVSLTMVVDPRGGADQIAGYRLLAFYP